MRAFIVLELMKIGKLTIKKCLFKINIEKMRFTCLDDVQKHMFFYIKIIHIKRTILLLTSSEESLE